MRGFSLIETIIVISILGIIGSVSVATYGTMSQSVKPKQAATIYTQVLREASQKAQTLERDTAWGVKILDNNLILFSGTSYAGRTTALDSTYRISNNLNVSGPTEIIFSKFSGIPSSTGTTIFTNQYASSSVIIGPHGLISH